MTAPFCLNIGYEIEGVMTYTSSPKTTAQYWVGAADMQDYK